MKLKKCLEITKTVKFQVFIYPKGHIRENRGMNEVSIDMFDLNRNVKGNLPYNSFEKYASCKVVEIIPHSESVTIVAEVN